MSSEYIMEQNDYTKPFLEGSCKLGIIGQGYVGLPLGAMFAQKGIHVLGFDVDLEKVQAINRGESPVPDVPSESLRRLVETGMLEASGDFDRLNECGAISICVPTPLSKSRDPDVSFIKAAVSEIKKRLKPGQLIILESTTYPGTTEELVWPELESTGLRVGRDFYLAFSPERVDPGNTKYTVRNTPKVLGGITPECTRRAELLYRQAIQHVYTVSNTRTAEMVKLLENTFRAVNIGFVNELAQMCKRLDIDVWEVIEAARTKPFGFMPFYPGPGLGGHCIPIDPLYLSWKMHHLNYKAMFIDLADTINASMPRYVVSEVMEQLNDDGMPLKGSKVLILGVAYKEDIADTRESPALDVASLLMTKGAEVLYHDPHVAECLIDGHELVSRPLTDELLGNVDLVLIITGHSAVDYARVVEKAARVFDAKNTTGRIRLKGNVRKL